MPYLSMPLMALTAFMLSACNTIEGFGEDVEHAGDAIEDSSERTQRGWHR